MHSSVLQYADLPRTGIFDFTTQAQRQLLCNMSEAIIHFHIHHSPSFSPEVVQELRERFHSA